MSFGLVGEAMRMFEELELWDNLIDCYWYPFLCNFCSPYHVGSYMRVLNEVRVIVSSPCTRSCGG